MTGGPSGAGKDTLLLGARKALADASDSNVLFLKRDITRDASKCTDLEISVTPQKFDARRGAGEYALCWEAHETKYGILKTDLEPALAAGKRCVLNVSRTVVEEARKKYGATTSFQSEVYFLNITASDAALIERLLARGREDSMEQVQERVKRAKEKTPKGEFVIHIVNELTREEGINQVVASLKSPPAQAPIISEREYGSTLILFDVDGTLNVAGQDATPEMLQLLASLRERYAVGIVGAGEYAKQQRQTGGGDMSARFDFCFSENGVHAFAHGEQIHLKSAEEHLGPTNFAFFQTELAKTMADYRAEAEQLLRQAAPNLKLSERGTFLQKKERGEEAKEGRRQCTMNITPIGRTPKMTKEERGLYDKADRAGTCNKIIIYI